MANKFFTLEDAVAVAELAHRGQVDKSGMAYINHPKRVLAAVQAQGARRYVQAAAVLHDVIEDTPFTAEMLTALGFSEAVVGLVVLLTRTPENRETYYSAIAANADATLIKRADINDNLQDWRLAYLSADTQLRLKRKYRLALQALEGAGK